MEENKNEINKIIEELKGEFEKLIMSNPYLLKILSKDRINKIKISYESGENRYVDIDPELEYKKFRNRDIFKMLISFFIGFSFFIIIVCAYYFINNKTSDITLPNHEGNWQIVLSSIISHVMPIVAGLCSIIIGIWSQYLKNITGKDVFFNTVLGLVLCLFLAIIVYFRTLNSELLLFICPLMGYFVMMFSLFFIYNPLSSRRLNNTIIENAKLIQNKLDSLNKSMVQKSHSDVLHQIEKVEKSVQDKNTEALLKIQTLTVLDSLRLELIQNSISGINLVEDWKYLDLSKKMMEEIMSCENKKITILGDLSFLSTESGVEQLVNAINGKDKEFVIYFTGKKIPNERNTIESKHCQDLVDNIRKKYDEAVREEIKNKILLIPILSESFTGIGFIGLHNNRDDDFKKVYAYISSLLASGENMDITRVNPLVFSWNSNLTYFRAFLESKVVYDESIRVKIDGEGIIANDILNLKKRSKQKSQTG